jgi:hypothetical protein
MSQVQTFEKLTKKYRSNSLNFASGNAELPPGSSDEVFTKRQAGALLRLETAAGPVPARFRGGWVVKPAVAYYLTLQERAALRHSGRENP